MPEPAANLESAILAALAPLVGIPHPDRPSRGGRNPHVSLGRTSMQDWSTGAETGEQLLTVHVWSKDVEGGDTVRLTGIVRERLGKGLHLDDGRVVTMRLEFEETRYDAEFALHHALLRFRAYIGEAVG